MLNKEFRILIKAPAEKVWAVLIGETTYPKWTAPFCEGSRAETDWKKGSKALFFDGNNTGMVAVIEESIPNKFLSIKHLGEIKNGVEDLESDKVKEWAGALENYTLHSVGNQTELIVTMDLSEKYKDFFMQVWPRALQKVKELSEAQ